MRFPKQRSFLCPEYVEWVRTLPCEFCGTRYGVQAHHVIHRSRGVTRDDTCVPSCIRCHKRAHGETVVDNGKRLLPLGLAEQDGAADRTRSEFIEHASPEQWEAFNQAWREWKSI